MLGNVHPMMENADYQDSVTIRQINDDVLLVGEQVHPWREFRPFWRKIRAFGEKSEFRLQAR